MSELFEGNFQMRVVEASISNVKGKMKVRIELEIADGPRAGRRVSYDGKLDADNIKWTKLDMVGCGWKGKDVRTFVSDVMSSGKVIAGQARIASYTYPDSGKLKEWVAAERLGRAPAVTAEPLNDDQYKDVNAWFAEVPDDDRGAPASDDSLPF